MVAAAIFIFSDLRFLTIGTAKKVKLCHMAKFRQNRLNCGRDIVLFLISLNGGRDHLGISKFENFNGRNSQEGQTASLCLFLSSLEPRPRYGVLGFFKMAAAAILDFKI